ncbi:MAG: hypothetical protein JO102_05735 [Elusimicrobia bacterium]|nr:hypothetical protein [Elusimicrobiota bacterium]
MSLLLNVMPLETLVTLIVILLGSVETWIFTSRRKREKLQRAAADSLRRVEQNLIAVAADNNWELTMRPSSALWYRIFGRGPDGVRWEIAEGAPRVENGVIRTSGARWNTDAVRAPYRLVELLPRGLYDRMKRAATAGAWDAAWSISCRKLVLEGFEVALRHPRLAEHIIAVALAPALAERLLADETEEALARLETDELRVSLGFPNLRISTDLGASTPEILKSMVDAGVLLARRYHRSVPTTAVRFAA